MFCLYLAPRSPHSAEAVKQEVKQINANILSSLTFFGRAQRAMHNAQCAMLNAQLDRHTTHNLTYDDFIHSYLYYYQTFNTFWFSRLPYQALARIMEVLSKLYDITS